MFKLSMLFLVGASLAICCAAQQTGNSQTLEVDDGTQTKATKPESKYNAELAEELGADEYGMKAYVFVLLKTGKVIIEEKEESQKVFAGHFANMSRLAEAGKLVLAGPFIDGEPKRGLFILNVATIAEAEALVKTDPAVAAGVFDYELTKLYSSAALMKIGEIHETVQKTKID
ncbi:MAG: YciI family protein [Pirellulaceae bacterium]